MVLEYVSAGLENQRKDYEINRLRYERDLAVPYYLIFDPLTKKLTFLHLVNGRYRNVKKNENGRYPVPELKLELAVHEGWVRFWFEGELLPLAAEMLAELTQAREKTIFEKQSAEQERLRAEQEKIRAEREKQRADQEKIRAEHEKQKAEQERARADTEAEKNRQLLEKLRKLGIDLE
jgi:uncharacterized membrane protein YqiK